MRGADSLSRRGRNENGDVVACFANLLAAEFPAMRTAAKRDENEPEIIEALQAIGAKVKQLSQKDCPDLVVGFRGRISLIEVKMPGKPLRPGRKDFHGEWMGFPVYVAQSALEAIQQVST